MPLRMAITKNTAQGETFVVDVCQWNPVTGAVLHTVDEMSAMADAALALADARLLDMHTKMLEAESLEQYCTAQEWSRIVSVLDIISGRQTVDLVKRRWHSEREETEELEAARAVAQRDEIKMCAECYADEPISNMTIPDLRHPNIYVCKGCLPLVAGKELRVEGEKGQRSLYT